MERLLNILVLLNVHFLVFYKNYRPLVMILATVIWRGENRNNGGKGLLTAPAVHLVAVGLDLVGANYAQIVVLGEQLFDGFEAEFDGTFALIVACVGFFSCFFVI
jgi:hypothetical protein